MIEAVLYSKVSSDSGTEGSVQLGLQGQVRRLRNLFGERGGESELGANDDGKQGKGWRSMWKQDSRATESDTPSG